LGAGLSAPDRLPLWLFLTDSSLPWMAPRLAAKTEETTRVRDFFISKLEKRLGDGDSAKGPLSFFGLNFP
jgi:hypothetical protein